MLSQRLGSRPSLAGSRNFVRLNSSAHQPAGQSVVRPVPARRNERMAGCRLGGARRGLAVLHAMPSGDMAPLTDLVGSHPAVDLIMRTAGQAAGHLDAQILHSVVHPLAQALGAPDTVPNAVDGIEISALGAVADSWQTAAQSALPAAATASTPQHLHMVATWAAEKLAVVQAIDPAVHDSLSSSLAVLTDGLQEVAAAQQAHAAAAAAAPWTNALVLGVQQLVTALRAPGANGLNLEGVLAAQEAVTSAAAADTGGIMRAATALLSGGAAGEMPAGLTGLLQLLLALTAMIIASVPRHDWRQQLLGSSEATDELPLRYDIPALNAYFSRRPLLVLRRNAEVVGRLSTFVLAILADWRLGVWKEKMVARAEGIRQIVEDLGPAYIKIAQAVSTRVDIVSEPYANAFASLQDNVRVFSTVEAREVLEESLDRPVDEVFEWLSEAPIAAASLGQVYRGKLRDELGGREVAVKVQRPGALESVALDVFIMRRAAQLFSQLPGMSEKWATALDDWALRFFLEMDYELEAQNTMTFKAHMAQLQGIKVATVYPELTSRRVIVTEWIEGTRLAESRPEDVRALSSTLLNCYLIQLLETGLLHADPHPGNLMLTSDGKIVVLDFGLMTEVSEEQRIALVEYIAHLTAEDWEGVANDLVKLGFMPEGLEPGVAVQIAPVMEKVMGQLVRGGGLRNGFSITGIATELSGVAMNYQLAIPPYFGLVLRAFSVIEGIALKVDPNYAIVQECMPYMSRRLLSDNNPRMRAALRQLLYGTGSRLDVQRLQRMLSSFTSFTTSAAPAPAQLTRTSSYDSAGLGSPSGFLGAFVTSLDDGPVLSEPMKEVIKVVFSKEGSYAQEILVDEAVAAIDAMSRQGLAEALRLMTTTAGTLAAVRGFESLGPLRAMLLPLPLPAEILATLRPAVALTAEDKQALSTLRAVLHMVAPPVGVDGVAGGPDLARMSIKAARLAREVAPLLPELMPGMQMTAERLMKQLARRMALRLAEDLDPSAPPLVSSGGNPSAAATLPPPGANPGASASSRGNSSQRDRPHHT